MDNIIIEKIWNDNEIYNNELFEVKLTCINEYIKITENVYMDNSIVKNISKKIENYIKNNKEMYFEINMKRSCSTGFSIKIFPYDLHGYILIEMKMEIYDNSQKLHYAIFYIKTEIGLLEKFGINIKKLMNLEIGEKIELNNI